MNLAAPHPTRPDALVPSKLMVRDIPAVATVGPRTRRMRTVLTALGIAIGIAALIAVMGISASSKADLLHRLDALGTNRLQIEPGKSVLGANATLPKTSSDRVRRLQAIDQAAAVTALDAPVRRNSLISDNITSGITTRAADGNLLGAIGATVERGRWHDDVSVQLPTVVLGAVAAQRLGIHEVDGRSVLVGTQRFTVIGILDPIPLYPSLDSGAFIGYPIATSLLDAATAPTVVYVTTNPDTIRQVRSILPATVNPLAPDEVAVSNPSDALAAKDAVDDTLTALLLGLGGVALLVGGIGIANVMVIGVLERRTEIGVRRALGATKRHIRIQFLLEAVLLGTLGGLIGVALGAAVTYGYDRYRDLTFALPPNAVWTGLGAAISIGAIAGLSPAARAARLAPSEAIRPA